MMLGSAWSVEEAVTSLVPEAFFGVLPLLGFFRSPLSLPWPKANEIDPYPIARND
jgi:hypothetical protein